MIRANTAESVEYDSVAQSAEELDEEMSTSELSDIEGASAEKKTRRARLTAIKRKVKKPFEFAQNNQDVLGVVFMEVQAAKDLPPERNGNFVAQMWLTFSDTYGLRYGSLCHRFFWEENFPYQSYSA